MNLETLIKESLVDEPDASRPTIDVHMFQVQFKPDARKGDFLAYLREQFENGGMFNNISPARMAQGPSYIEIGGWVGAQQEALILMALGEHHGLWKVITPKAIGVEDEEIANQLAGQGFVMIDGFNPASLEA